MITVNLSINGETNEEILKQLIKFCAVATSEQPLLKTEKVKKAAPKKEVQEDLPVEDESETDLGFDNEVPEEEPKVTLNDVIKGFQLYAKEKGKDKAAKVLAKYKVKSVRDLKEEVYAKVLSDIEV